MLKPTLRAGATFPLASCAPSSIAKTIAQAAPASVIWAMSSAPGASALTESTVHEAPLLKNAIDPALTPAMAAIGWAALTISTEAPVAQWMFAPVAKPQLSQ